jgi:2-polyprenyl-3-methyl-5-hydroxy-6-metoxy-1,4-benzoquinol methylase
MSGLGLRGRHPERMDDPALDRNTYARVLRDLARVNRWTLATRPTLAFLARATRQRSAFSLLDVGFGHGDMLRTIASWARRRGLSATLVGVDLNPNSAPAARAATADWMGIDYRTGDYRDQGAFDFVVSSLVAHHMSDRELIDFIRYMEAAASVGWMINDLHRHRVAHAGYPLLARLLGVHPIVRSDGTLSIANAFRPPELAPLLREAGVPAGAARIVRRFPFRLCVERLR